MGKQLKFSKTYVFKMATKTLFKFFAYFIIIFQSKKSWSHKTEASRFFFLFLLDDRRLLSRIRHLVLSDPDQGGPKTYGSYGSGSAKLLPRVGDPEPDPHVFGPPGSGSISESGGSRSFPLLINVLSGLKYCLQNNILTQIFSKKFNF